MTFYDEQSQFIEIDVEKSCNGAFDLFIGGAALDFKNVQSNIATCAFVSNVQD